MSDRRKFLQQSAALALGGLLAPRFAFPEISPVQKGLPNAGLQLYTLMNLMAEDPKGTLQKVAAIGYKELETSASPRGYYYGYKPKELAAMAKDMGMVWRSHHVMGAPIDFSKMRGPSNKQMTAADSARAKQMAERFKFFATIPTLKNNYQQLVDEAAEGGLSYLVCASIPVGTLDQIKVAAEVFSKAGEACKKAGIQFAYHNHTTEFDSIEGHRPFDYILSNTDKDLVKMELDLAWATKANQNPVELFKQHPQRFPLWHVKDLDGTSKNPTEVGNGIVDFKPIFAARELSGMKYFFVEQDNPPQPLENVATSYKNLKKILA